MALIEIEPGVFYDTEKPWWEQDEGLISTAQTVMQGEPKSESAGRAFDAETQRWHSWKIWEHTTSLGIFDMRVDFYFHEDSDSKAFDLKSIHNLITVTQIS